MNQPNALDALRHSCSHVMAQAVKELWPEVKLAIGPSIENGFYYDFQKEEAFTDKDLKQITKRMYRIIEKKSAFVQESLGRDEAIELFEKMGEPFKVELIQALPEDEEISIFKTGDDFFDLCKGPHVENTGLLKAFKLLSVAGSYWRGDEKNAQLQRIYGTCFETKEDLTAHLKRMEEALKRDHRKLGTSLELFDFYHQEAGAGLVFYLPDGATLRRLIEQYVCDEHTRRGYEMVVTPHILKGKLWEQSGHADHYRENMYFFKVDEEDYAVKPMNCPGHMLIYKSKRRSYRDLPLKLFELGTVYRQEKAGVLHGLLRVRGFTQDDAHIFCRETQLKDEVKKVIDFMYDLMDAFGFKDIDIEISTRPEKYIGKLEDWDVATKALKASLEEKELPFQINEGDGAFYGPKIDIKLRDALGRQWQCATIQCDFSLPERFDLTYTNEEGEAVRPIMIHRALLGSVERFIGTLIEHYGGAFPVWLAPRQVVIIPVNEEFNDYAQELKQDLQFSFVRVIIDNRNESLGKKVREGTVKKTPYLLVIGEKEVADRSVAVRQYGQGEQGVMAYSEFKKILLEKIQNKM